MKRIFATGYAQGYAWFFWGRKEKTKKIAVEKHEFSTLSTGLSTEPFCAGYE